MAENFFETFKKVFGLEDSSEATDASSANNYVVEAAILKAQEDFKTLTDCLAETSAQNEERLEKLQKLREAVTVSYAALLDKDIDTAIKALRKVLSL